MTKDLPKACERADCPCVLCTCPCHDPGISMMHMFACCFPAACKSCGKQLMLADNYPGVNERGVAWEPEKG